MWIDPRSSRRHSLCRFMSAVVAAACLGLALPVAAAPALPDWDAAKKKPAPLPDWDAAKKKPGDGAKKKPGGKRPVKPPVEAPVEAQPEAPVEAQPEAPVEAQPEAPVEAQPEPTPPAASEPVVAAPASAVVEGPAEAPAAAPTQSSRERAQAATRRARGELIAGSVLMGVGAGGLGAMTAGVLLERSTDDASASATKRAETLIAAGAVTGAIGVLLGLALVVDGVRDRRAARATALARVQVAPSFGGLALSGRF